jgi:hypothetical protein
MGRATPPADPETDRGGIPLLLRLGVLKKGECKTLCEKKVTPPNIASFFSGALQYCIVF